MSRLSVRAPVSLLGQRVGRYDAPMPEEHKERVDRELIELLNELRVALPGVQVLFAFLLIVPFTEGFRDVDDVARSIYFASLIAAAASSALLIAPSSIHRIRFREPDKEQILFTSNRLLLVGLALLAAAMTGTVFVIAEVMFGALVATVVALVTAAWFAWFWYGLAFVQRRETERTPHRRAKPG
jgi:hypothetical protein